MENRIMQPQPKFDEVLERMPDDKTFYGWFLDGVTDKFPDDDSTMELDGHLPPEDMPESYPVQIDKIWYWHG